MDVQNELISKADELESRRITLFDSQDETQFQRQLADLQRRANVLSETLRSTESIEFQISQFFSFPIAYGYRLLVWWLVRAMPRAVGH